MCNESHRFLVQEQLRRAGARPKAILLEPKGAAPRPALTLAAIHAVTADDPVLIAMPSDHFIAQRDAFQRAMERGAALARAGAIVAFGVPPTAARDRLRLYPRAKARLHRRRSSRSPTPPTAQAYFASGQYLWNAGIFAVRASVWLDAIGELRPDIFKACERAYRQGKRDGGFSARRPGRVRANAPRTRSTTR